MSREAFYPLAYHYMLLSRAFDDAAIMLYRQGKARGTVIPCMGNEATNIGLGLPFRPGKDVLSFLHRDLCAHVMQGADLFALFCQYLANEGSITHAREGNVHHGNVPMRRFPMISHLGDMLALVVGGVYAARQANEEVYGCAVIGDGGTSTGDFHESVNIASVRNIPVLFLIENNHYAYSTPTRYQYNCANLSDRALGYGILGKTVDGCDPWAVYLSVCDALDIMKETSKPYILESQTLRLAGHAVYDNAEYVTEAERTIWMTREPIARARSVLETELSMSAADIDALEASARDLVTEACGRATQLGRPTFPLSSIKVFASSEIPKLKPFAETKAKNNTAVTQALSYILSNEPSALLLGEDIGPYGSAFKTCKGLFEKFGEHRVMDMPIAEAGIAGFALGASQCGAKPIIEFQFADFGTEAVTQIGLNAGTWFFRAHQGAQILYRFPCGGGVTLGAFHSAEFDGLWSRFPGLKLLYPFTPQETFEALVAGFYDPNPCLVFEHKLLYGSSTGDISFDGDVSNVFKSRSYSTGSDITIIGFGAMLKHVQTLASTLKYSMDIWNPFILNPFDLEPLIASVRKTGRLLIVQEAGVTAGIGATLSAKIVEEAFSSLKTAPRLIGAPDIPVPFAPELEKQYLPNIDTIREAITSMMGELR